MNLVSRNVLITSTYFVYLCLELKQSVVTNYCKITRFIEPETDFLEANKQAFFNVDLISLISDDTFCAQTIKKPIINRISLVRYLWVGGSLIKCNKYFVWILQMMWKQFTVANTNILYCCNQRWKLQFWNFLASNW